MSRTASLSAILLTLTFVAACSKAPEREGSGGQSVPASATAKKCPDPDIRDRNDPCSPLYWRPHDSALKNSKSF